MPERPKILIVDDEPLNVDYLEPKSAGKPQLNCK
jgi:hypothetical protein